MDCCAPIDQGVGTKLIEEAKMEEALSSIMARTELWTLCNFIAKCILHLLSSCVVIVVVVTRCLASCLI